MTSSVEILLIPLVDQDAAAFVLLRLRHHDAEDAVVKRSSDAVGVDPAGELEGTREFADAALGDPEAVLGLGRLRLLSDLVLVRLGYADSGRRRSRGALRVVLDRGLMRLVVVLLLRGFGNGAGLGCLLEKVAGGSAGLVGALDAAADYDGLRVGELHVHVLLLDTRKLAVELIVVLGLSQVKLGSEGRKVAGVTAALLGSGGVVVLQGVLVKVVNETEETREVGLSGSVESRSEHRHFG